MERVDGDMAQAETAKRGRGRPSKTKLSPDKDHRQAILLQAEEEFGEKGFNGASVSSIANGAQVAQPLINYYFASKAKLWEAVMQNIYEALQPALAVPNEAELNAEAVLRQRIHNFVLFSASRPALAFIIASELRTSGPRLKFLREKYIGDLERDFARLMSQAFGISLRDKRLKFLFPLILSACAGPFLHRSYITEQHKLDPTTPRQAKLYADMTVELLISGIKEVTAE